MENVLLNGRNPKHKFSSKNGHVTLSNKKLFLEEKRADIHFLFEAGVRVPAHKLILANGSSVFDTMFDGRWKDEKEVRIVDATPAVFKEFLQFFYKNDVTVTAANLIDVMNMANKYDVTECLNVCEQMLMKNSRLDDICIGLEAAILFNRSRLKEHCKNEIQKAATNVLASDAFLRISQDTLRFIMKIDNLNCKQVELIDACMNWAKNACKENNTDANVMKNRRKELGDCLNLVKFDLMEPVEIAKFVTKYKGFFERDELEEIFKSICLYDSESLTKLSPPSKIQWTDHLSMICSRYNKRINTRSGEYRLDEYNYYKGREFLDYAGSNDRIYKDSFKILPLDVTAFQVNKELLFGAISTLPVVSNNNDRSNSLTGIMTISENSALNSDDGKVLLVQPITLRVHTSTEGTETCIKLNKVLLVKANKVYQILVTFGTTWSHNTFSTNATFKAVVSFGDAYTGTFMQSDGLCYNNILNGIICALHFNSV